MISTSKLIKGIVFVIAILFFVPNINAQILKKLSKRAERTVERKLERKVEKETSKGMDSILDPNDKSSQKKTPNSPKSDNPKSVKNNPNVSDNLEVYSKFDFVPGDKLETSILTSILLFPVPEVVIISNQSSDEVIFQFDV